MTERTIAVASIIDERPIGALQWRIVLLCGLIALLDGFDTQAIGYVAPLIAADWGVPMSGFGAIFSASLFGLMIGAMVFGPIGDWVGRKPVLLASFAMVGLCTLLTGFAESSGQLLALRFLTGLGLGGTVPNAIALTAEYAPRRHRAALVTLMFAGFPLGAGLGGLAVAPLIADSGWRAVFFVGGVLPLLLSAATLRLLPESLRFLVAKRPSSPRIAAILGRIDPAYSHQPGDRFVIEEDKVERGPMKGLFGEGRAVGTTLLWLVFFCNLLILYFILNWLPAALARERYSLDQAIMATALFNIGGVLGGLSLGRLVDRFGPYLVLTAAFAAGAALVAMIGTASGSMPALLAVIFGAGFAVIGCQFCINILAIEMYPTAVRSTGLGWAVGIGRIGAILGPMLGGFMLAQHWTAERIFMVGALPSLLCALWVVALYQARPGRGGTTPAVAAVR